MTADQPARGAVGCPHYMASAALRHYAWECPCGEEGPPETDYWTAIRNGHMHQEWRHGARERINRLGRLIYEYERAWGIREGEPEPRETADV